MIIFYRLIMVLILTVLTQIGGVAFLVALGVAKLFHVQIALSRLLIFLVTYGAMSFATVIVAPAFGRVALPCFGDGSLASQSPMYCVLNRQYVSPDMLGVVVALADQMAIDFPGTQTLTLDANFPFFDGFPLLPHLSHDDGEKLDLAFYYQSDGAYAPGRTRSPIGYWGFEEPRSNDPPPCATSTGPTLRWDMEWVEAFHRELTLDTDRTRAALQWLSAEGAQLGVTKIFVEPHLQNRLGIQDETIRFQGCRAARHDDHIHIQL